MCLRRKTGFERIYSIYFTGLCNVEGSSLRRMSELHRRNTLQPPHMRSAYPTEANDERLRKVNAPIIKPQPSTSKLDENVQQLSAATSLLSVNTPPAMNTRKRRSSSWNQADSETPVVVQRKRRSFEADVSMDVSDTRLSISSSPERRKRREPSQTTYQRPGPPTPARNSLKENISTPSVRIAFPTLFAFACENESTVEYNRRVLFCCRYLLPPVHHQK